MTVLFACGTYGLPSAELPREFKDSVGVHCRRCGQELGTPPVAILNGRRPMRLRASRPRWSVSKESCATGFREAGSISKLSSWNIDRMARKGAAPKGGPSLGGNAQGGQQHRYATLDAAAHN